MSLEEVSLEAIEQELMRRKQQHLSSLRNQISTHVEAIRMLEESIRRIGQARPKVRPTPRA